MIKYVLIDLDGTLLDFNKGEENAFTNTIKKCINITPTKEEYLKFSNINEYYFNEYHNGNMTRDLFHFNRFNEILNYYNIKKDPYELDKIYVDELKYQANPYSDAKILLEYLSLKYQLFVASNGMTEIQKKRLEVCGLLKYFDKLYVSEAITYNKPDKRFFDYVFNDLKDFNKDKYIIIGDRLDTDILGGLESGIKTIYVNRDNSDLDIKRDYEVKNLIDIKNIL